jgi:hypothetical protein
MTTPEPKRIALVAHDDRKRDLLEWAEYNRDILADHTLCATGTTGRLLSARSISSHTGLSHAQREDDEDRLVRNVKNIRHLARTLGKLFYREGFVYLYDELSSPGIKSS